MTFGQASKIRLDKLLVDLGFFDSREKARTTIMMNGVKIAGQLKNKPGDQIKSDKFYEEYEKDNNYIEVDIKIREFVSRGAYKLKAAWQKWNIDFKDKFILDIGASTGGFTDFSLKQGAKKVLAIDVGHGQLDYSLQNHEQVINKEKTNFKDVTKELLESFEQKIDIVVADLSFISIVTILEKLKTIVDYPLDLYILLKPQFEAGKEIMDKCRGVIKDDKTRQEVKEKTINKIIDMGFSLIEEIESPIKGTKGNVEYLLYLKMPVK